MRIKHARLGSVKLGMLLLLCGAASVLRADSDLPIGVSPAGDLLEAWRTPEFSAADLPGLRIEGQLTSDLITALIPAELAGLSICVRVSAAQDHYFGLQTFSVAADWTGGITGIPLRTSYLQSPRDLRSIQPEDALIRVSVGACESGSTDTLLVSGWKTLAGLGRIDLFVNALLEERVELYLASSNKRIPCTILPDESRSYTHRCTIDAGILPPGLHTIEILRFLTLVRGGLASEEPQGAKTIELWIAAP